MVGRMSSIYFSKASLSSRRRRIETSCTRSCLDTKYDYQSIHMLGKKSNIPTDSKAPAGGTANATYNYPYPGSSPSLSLAPYTTVAALALRLDSKQASQLLEQQQEEGFS